jgi:hypothetical protein
VWFSLIKGGLGLEYLRERDGSIKRRDFVMTACAELIQRVFYKLLQLAFWLLLLLFLLFPFRSASVEEGQWKYSTGFDYSSGDYNDSEKTEMLYVPFTVSYAREAWTWKLATGWVSIDGPGSVIDDGVVVSGGGGSRTESGMADTWLSLGREVSVFPVELGYLDLTGKIKLPTADEDKGLGTGAFDYVFQADYLYGMGDLTPMLTAAYKFKGDADDVDLEDVLYLSAGADWRYSDHTHVGASLDFQQASTDGVDDPLELFTYVSYKVNDSWSVLPYAYVGLSDSSPDAGGGFQFVFKPNGGRP